MDKVIGFFLTEKNGKLTKPSWLPKYPWLETEEVWLGDWKLLLWGHGNLSHFVNWRRVVVGYSETDLETLRVNPPENRGILIELADAGGLHVVNDAYGSFPVLYGVKDGASYAGSCEETLLATLAPVTLSPWRLVNYLTFACPVGRTTPWEEIDQLYANSILNINAGGGITQELQPPMEFIEQPGFSSEAIHLRLQDLARKYTDPLGGFLLSMSAGFDSRFILMYSNRPERIRVRTYPLSQPPDESSDVVIARESALRCGVEDIGILDFEDDYSPWVESAIRHYGTMASPTQSYIFGATAMLGREPGLPILSGIGGDVFSGRGLQDTLDRIERADDPGQRFKIACACLNQEWWYDELNRVLNVSGANAAKRAAEGWRGIWEGTEGPTLHAKATLIRLRNRTNHYITHAWASADLWGSMVSAYYDREYGEWSLSLPKEVLLGRMGQIGVMYKYHADLWPDRNVRTRGGYPKLCYRGTIHSHAPELVPKRLWPLRADGSLPAHGLFKRAGIRDLYARAMAGGARSFRKLTALQPIALTIQQGYVKEA